MKIRRINENTISCIITPEDLRENGFRIDDFFDRKKEAVLVFGLAFWGGSIPKLKAFFREEKEMEDVTYGE